MDDTVADSGISVLAQSLKRSVTRSSVSYCPHRVLNRVLFGALSTVAPLYFPLFERQRLPGAKYLPPLERALPEVAPGSWQD